VKATSAAYGPLLVTVNVSVMEAVAVPGPLAVSAKSASRPWYAPESQWSLSRVTPR
jgi:hypothetical protein